jgi:DNA-binding transcriptional MerR regulator
MRIGELARRTGVSPEVLRAWERRYDLLHPSRSDGGFRLYSDDDEARVRRVTEAIARGFSASEAARLASQEERQGTDRSERTTPEPVVDELAGRLRRSLDSYRASEAHSVFDQLLGVTSVEAVLADVVIPYLHELGARWSRGEASVAQEHFASNFLRGRLQGLARSFGPDGGRGAVLACLPGESHDLGLLIFAILIGRKGWRVTFLGSDTPFDTLDVSVRALRPHVVVLATLDDRRLAAHADAVRRLAAVVPVAIAGRVDGALADEPGVSLLPPDIVQAAASLN